MNINEIISSGLLELYVTGAASKQEAEQVEQWVTEYPEVKNEIDELQKAMENYALAEAIEPSASVREKIFSKIKSESGNEDAGVSTVSTSVNNTFKREAVVYSIPSYFKWTAAASIVLLIGSLIFNYTLYNKYRSAKVAQQQLQSQKNATEIALNDLQQQNQQSNKSGEQLQRVKPTGGTVEEELQHQREITEALRRDLNVVTDKYSLPVVLKGTKHSPQALAKIFWMKNTGEVYVDTRNLPEAPAGKQYQLWAIVDGNPVDAGMITTSKGSYKIQKMKSFGKADAFAITMEKAGGSPTPTMEEMVVQAKIKI